MLPLCVQRQSSSLEGWPVQVFPAQGTLHYSVAASVFNIFPISSPFRKAVAVSCWVFCICKFDPRCHRVLLFG